MNEAQIIAAIRAELDKGPRTIPHIARETGLAVLTVRPYIERMAANGEVVKATGRHRWVLAPKPVEDPRQWATEGTEYPARRDVNEALVSRGLIPPTRVVESLLDSGAVEPEADTVDLADHAEGAARGLVRCGTGVPVEDLPEGDRQVVENFVGFLEFSKANPGACYVTLKGLNWECWTHTTRWPMSGAAPGGCQSPDDGEPGEYEAKLVESGLAEPAPVVAGGGFVPRPGAVAWTVDEDGGMVPIRVAEGAKLVERTVEGPLVRDAEEVLDGVLTFAFDGLPPAYARRHGSRVVVAGRDEAPEGVTVVRDAAAPVPVTEPRFPEGSPQYDAYQAHLTATLKTWRETGSPGRELDAVAGDWWYIERLSAVKHPYAAAIGHIEAVVGKEEPIEARFAEVRVILASLEAVVRGEAR